MSRVKILAGDLPLGAAEYCNGYILGIQVSTVEIATEQSIKKVGGTLAGGIVGGVLLGPLGTIGGMLVGGNKKEVVFVVQFTSGEQALARADSNIFTKIQADIFNGPVAAPHKSLMSGAAGLGMFLGFTTGFAGGLFFFGKHLWPFVAALVSFVPALILGAVGGIIFSIVEDSGKKSRKEGVDAPAFPHKKSQERDDNHKYELEGNGVTVWTVPLDDNEKTSLLNRIKSKPSTAHIFVWPEVIIDWDGVCDAQGTPIQFSKRNAELLGSKGSSIFSELESEIKKSVGKAPS